MTAYLETWSETGRRCMGACGQLLPWEDFPPRAKGKNGRASVCRPCRNAARAQYRRDNRERLLPQERQRDRMSNRHIRRRYGIDRAQLDEMIKRQEGRCGICPEPLVKIFVDHDHDSGAVRDLLCPSCNIMLGMSGDSPRRLRDAAFYIERHRRTGRGAELGRTRRARPLQPTVVDTPPIGG